MGKFEICVDTYSEELTEIVKDQCLPDPHKCRAKRRYLTYVDTKLHVDITVNYAGNTERCEMEKVRVVSTSATSVLDKLHFDEQRNRKFEEMIGDLAKQSKIEGDVLGDKGNGECATEFRERIEAQQASLLVYLQSQVSEAPEFQSVDRRLGISGYHLRLWLGLAFDVVAARSELMGRILAGEIGFPDLEAMLKSAEDVAFPFELADRVTERGAQLWLAVQSREMEDVARFGFGHRIVNELRFDHWQGLP